jgi:hypothetical protein
VKTAILDYAPTARPRWLRRILLVILLLTAGAAIGAAVGDWVQPDRYVFDGWLAVPPPVVLANPPPTKQAYITAILAGIPAAAATLGAQGIPISASEFNDRLTLKDLPQTRVISIRCTSRSPDMPLAMVNALIIPYCNRTPGVSAMPGTLRRSTTWASMGFIVGAAAAGVVIVLCRRRVLR